VQTRKGDHGAFCSLPHSSADEIVAVWEGYLAQAGCAFWFGSPQANRRQLVVPVQNAIN
jgi:hypothetical protein